MPAKRVTAAQRRFVRARAQGCCEYCRTPADCVPGSFAIEHIKPKAKGGQTTLRNLALSCPACNGHKFDKLVGCDPLKEKLVRLFNPRRQQWVKHFCWSADSTQLIGLTPTGRATVATPQMNQEQMLNLRRLLILAGLHPTEGAAN